MGVDLVAIIEHNLTLKELVDLPNQINTWDEVLDFFASYDQNQRPPIQSKWDGPIDEFQLELVWKYYELEDNTDIINQLNTFDSDIHCVFGSLSVLRNTILLTHWNHKYSNLEDPIKAQNILSLNRMIARRFNSNEILYCTDSTYPTQIIEDKALEGLHFSELKAFSLNRFGQPPESLNEARKYMFFLDNIDRKMDAFSFWDGTSPYWTYDSSIKEYKFRTKFE